METMTRTGERMETAGIPVKQVQPGTARMRDLTPAQRRAVLFAQQQVLRARAAKKAKDERQAELNRMRMEEDSFEPRQRAVSRGVETLPEERMCRCARPSAMCCAIFAPATTRRCVK